MIAGLAALAAVSLAAWGAARAQAAAPEAAARAFLSALAQADLARAQALAASRLAAELKMRGEALGRAGPVRLAGTEVTVTALGRDWARAAARVELEGADNPVAWYDLTLVRRGGAWLVADVQPARPALAGKNRGVPADFDPGAFPRYLEAVQRGAWAEAERELAGPALETQRRTRAVLGPAGAGLIGSFTVPEISPLWSDGKAVVARARYRVDGRGASVLATFYRTQEGWRIVEVAQE